MPISRVLLVEDFHTFRRAIRTLLETFPEFQVVGEAADGDEAIQLAAKLLPDVILLDINLPRLNGLQVVPHILNLSPSSKIIFLTQEPSPEVAEEALQLGASGDVVKVDAGSESLSALQAVTRDELYLSRQLSAQLHGDWAARLRVKHSIVLEFPRPELKGSEEMHPGCAHEAEQYLRDSDFQASLLACVGSAMDRGDAAIVLATAHHQYALSRGLRATGVAVDEELRSGRLQYVDADKVVSGCLGDEPPDETWSREEVRQLVESAEKARIGEHSRVCVFGECASLMLEARKGWCCNWSAFGET
jgi:DNA-binding NarL/FixJ family response regulator